IRFWYAEPRNSTRAADDTLNPYVLGPLMRYMNFVDASLNCPTNNRRANIRPLSNLNDPQWQSGQNKAQKVLWEKFLGERTLNFDYTMITGLSGAPMYATHRVAWNPDFLKNNGGQVGRPTTFQGIGAANFVGFRGVPVYMEEDSEWWNAQSPDG